jgi:hypothetical protein
MPVALGTSEPISPAYACAVSSQVAQSRHRTCTGAGQQETPSDLTDNVMIDMGFNLSERRLKRPETSLGGCGLRAAPTGSHCLPSIGRRCC